MKIIDLKNGYYIKVRKDSTHINAWLYINNIELSIYGVVFANGKPKQSEIINIMLKYIENHL